ncbi:MULTISPECIES: hypothetical protein [unclassified Microcoleus]|uniref:hypothetical protein n=1 Tax=unclassified Microcoleus TaxID=2642155 RepID=UPI002FD339CF
MNHKISELQMRYELASRQPIYDRMKAINVKPVKRGEISSESLDKLDKLDKFLKNNPGANLADFPKDAEAITPTKLDLPTRQVDSPTRQVDNFNETLQLVKAIARHFNQDPLAKYKALEYAANHVLLLPTSKVTELIGTKPRKRHFQWGTFIFNKRPKVKLGREAAWNVQMVANAFRPQT